MDKALMTFVHVLLKENAFQSHLQVDEQHEKELA